MENARPRRAPAAGDFIRSRGLQEQWRDIIP
jgi:hypothetical protein